MQENTKIKRSKGFFGLHFDFHAGPDCTEVGEGVSEEMVEHIVSMAKPDYLQCDCKGHPGVASYKTKVGTPAPGFKKDQLKIWRLVSERHNLPLVVHYSGVWDEAAIKANPSWARIDEKGDIDPMGTSVFGPYVDKLLLPQLKELIDDYGIDGAWVDGECWGTLCDYHENAVASFTEN